MHGLSRLPHRIQDQGGCPVWGCGCCVYPQIRGPGVIVALMDCLPVREDQSRHIHRAVLDALPVDPWITALEFGFEQSSAGVCRDLAPCLSRQLSGVDAFGQDIVSRAEKVLRHGVTNHVAGALDSARTHLP